MVLTPAEEEALLAKYERMLTKRVAEYCRHSSLPFSDYWNDLLQEARIAFLAHIRKIDDEKDLPKCGFDILHALCLARESMFVVHIPHGKFKSSSKNFLAIHTDDVRDQAHDHCTGGMLSGVMVEQFLGTLSADERTVVNMRLAGYHGREILPHTSFISDQQMSRCLNRIKEKVSQFFTIKSWTKGAR